MGLLLKAADYMRGFTTARYAMHALLRFLTLDDAAQFHATVDANKYFNDYFYFNNIYQQ